VPGSFQQQDIRHFVVVVDMQNVGLLLEHSCGSKKTPVDSMVIVGVRGRQLANLITMLNFDAFPSFVVRVASFANQVERRGLLER
jgi:hypothetical protein